MSYQYAGNKVRETEARKSLIIFLTQDILINPETWFGSDCCHLLEDHISCHITFLMFLYVKVE
jgi:hypothetical protein